MPCFKGCLRLEVQKCLVLWGSGVLKFKNALLQRVFASCQALSYKAADLQELLRDPKIVPPPPPQSSKTTGTKNEIMCSKH
eukprot:2291895-Amphidinium_carterae.1